MTILKIITIIILILIFIIFLITILFSYDNFRTTIIKSPIVKNILYKMSMDRNKWIHNKISHLLPKHQAKILNLGCGINTYSEYLEKLNYNVLAVDINDVSISNVPVLIYNGKKLPTCNYDVCILSTVLHHIPIKQHSNIMEMLKKCCKNVIILEDDLDNILTPIICMITNIQFYNHPMAFRNYNKWKQFLKNYGDILYSHTDKSHCVFHIKFKC